MLFNKDRSAHETKEMKILILPWRRLSHFFVRNDRDGDLIAMGTSFRLLSFLLPLLVISPANSKRATDDGSLEAIYAWWCMFSETTRPDSKICQEWVHSNKVRAPSLYVEGHDSFHAITETEEMYKGWCADPARAARSQEACAHLSHEAPARQEDEGGHHHKRRGYRHQYQHEKMMGSNGTVVHGLNRHASLDLPHCRRDGSSSSSSSAPVRLGERFISTMHFNRFAHHYYDSAACAAAPATGQSKFISRH